MSQNRRPRGHHRRGGVRRRLALVALILAATGLMIPAVDARDSLDSDIQADPIVGGWDAAAGAHPHLGSLQATGRLDLYDVDSGTWDFDSFMFGETAIRTDPVEQHNCGASLISPEWALTAAHCLVNPVVACSFCQVTKVRFYEYEGLLFGATRLSDSTDAQVAEIEEVVIHPEWAYLPSNYLESDVFTMDHFAHDLALIRLTEPIADIEPVRLGRSDMLSPVGSEITIAGWGRSHDPLTDTLTAGATDDLQEATAPVVASGECIPDIVAIEELTGPPDTVCVGVPGPLGNGVGICSGDSGGPAVIGDSGLGHVVVGVASYTLGSGCTDQSAYTSLRTETDWIESVVGEDLTPAPTHEHLELLVCLGETQWFTAFFPQRAAAVLGASADPFPYLARQISVATETTGGHPVDWDAGFQAWSYTPTDLGADALTFEISNTWGSATSVVELTVAECQPPQPAPIEIHLCAGDTRTIVGFNGPLDATFLGSAAFFDPDVGPYSWQLPSTSARGGSLTPVGDQSWEFRPAGGGLDSITYTVSNPWGSATGLIEASVAFCMTDCDDAPEVVTWKRGRESTRPDACPPLESRPSTERD